MAGHNVRPFGSNAAESVLYSTLHGYQVSPLLEQRLLCGCPARSRSHHDPRRDSHRPHTRRSLEHRSRNPTRGNRAHHVVLAPNIVDNGISDIVDQRDDARTVAKEAGPARHLIENGVEAKAHRWVVDAQGSAQPFAGAEEATNCQAGEVGRTGAIAEIVTPAARRESRACSFELVGLVVYDVQIFDFVLAQAGERVKAGSVELSTGEEGGGSRGIGAVEG